MKSLPRMKLLAQTKSLSRIVDWNGSAGGYGIRPYSIINALACHRDSSALVGMTTLYEITTLMVDWNGMRADRESASIVL